MQSSESLVFRVLIPVLVLAFISSSNYICYDEVFEHVPFVSRLNAVWLASHFLIIQKQYIKLDLIQHNWLIVLQVVLFASFKTSIQYSSSVLHFIGFYIPKYVSCLNVFNNTVKACQTFYLFLSLVLKGVAQFLSVRHQPLTRP